MAGFMAGFGPAFAQSFSQTRRDIEGREDDLFKIKYQDFLSTRDERNKTKKEESLAMRQAQQLAADLKDPDAAPFLYKQIMDFGVKSVEGKLADGRLSFDEGYKPQAVVKEKTVRDEMDMLSNAPNVSKAGQSRINRRLEEATNGTYSQVTGPQSSPYEGVDTGAYGWRMAEPEVKAGLLRDAIYNRNRYLGEGDVTRAKTEQLKIEAIREEAAMEAMIKANAESGAMESTMSNTWINTETGQTTQGSMSTRGGNPIFLEGPKKVARPSQNMRQMSLAELKHRSDVRTIAGGQVEDYNKQLSATMSILDLSGRLITIVNQSDDVLAERAGAVATGAATISKEFEAFSGMVDNLRSETMKTGQTEKTDQMVKDAERSFNRLIASGTFASLEDYAARKKVFDNIRVMLAYRQAEAMEGEGRFSDKDIELALQTITAPTSKTSFVDGLRNIIQESVARSYGMEATIENNGPLSVERVNFEEKWGYDMYQDSIKSVDFMIDQTKGPTRAFIDVAWEQYNNDDLFTPRGTPTPEMTEEGAPVDEVIESDVPFTREQIRQELLKRGVKLPDEEENLEGARGRKARRDNR